MSISEAIFTLAKWYPKMFVGGVFDGQNAPQVALQALQLAGPTWTRFGGVLVRQMKGTQDVVSTFDLQKTQPKPMGCVKIVNNQTSHGGVCFSMVFQVFGLSLEI